MIGDEAILGLAQRAVDDHGVDAPVEEEALDAELREGARGRGEEERPGRARAPAEPVAAEGDVGDPGVERGEYPVLEDDDVRVGDERIGELVAAGHVRDVELLVEVEARPDEP